MTNFVTNFPRLPIDTNKNVHHRCHFSMFLAFSACLPKKKTLGLLGLYINGVPYQFAQDFAINLWDRKITNKLIFDHSQLITPLFIQSTYPQEHFCCSSSPISTVCPLALPFTISQHQFLYPRSSFLLVPKIGPD